MEFSRIRTISEAILDSLEKVNIINLLEDLYEIGQNITRISLGENIEKHQFSDVEIGEKIENLESFLTKYLYHPKDAYEEILVERLNLGCCVGIGFLEQFDSYIEHEGSFEAKQHLDEIKLTKINLEKTIDLANTFEIPSHRINEKEGEFCIVLPYDDAANLGFVQSEMKRLLNGLKHLAEVISGKVDEPKVSVIEKGSLTAVVTVAATTAAVAYIVIKKITDLVDKYLDIKIKALKLKEMHKQSGERDVYDFQLQERIWKLEDRVNRLIVELNISKNIKFEEITSDKFKKLYLDHLIKNKLEGINQEILKNKSTIISKERINELDFSIRRFSEWLSKRLIDGSRISSVSFKISNNKNYDNNGLSRSKSLKIANTVQLLEKRKAQIKGTLPFKLNSLSK